MHLRFSRAVRMGGIRKKVPTRVGRFSMSRPTPTATRLARPVLHTRVAQHLGGERLGWDAILLRGDGPGLRGWRRGRRRVDLGSTRRWERLLRALAETGASGRKTPGCAAEAAEAGAAVATYGSQWHVHCQGGEPVGHELQLLKVLGGEPICSWTAIPAPLIDRAAQNSASLATASSMCFH